MSEHSYVQGGHRHRGGFLERLAGGLFQAMEHALDAEDLSRRDGFLQRLDPRVKVAGHLALILAAVATRSLPVLGALLLAGVALAMVSRVTLGRLFRQVWLGALAFTGAIALPAVFLVPGDVVARVPGLSWPITSQGVTSALFLVGRAETAATFALLPILCTPWPHVLKALRILRVPAVLVAILGMTHRYVFVLLRTASQMAEARRSRLVGPLSPRERRRTVTASAGALLGRALHLGAEVHLAMVSRGYRGEVRLLDDFRMRRLDWVALAGYTVLAVLAFRWRP